MDLNWLQDFLCLDRTRNFTRAAQERNVTQSAFSRRIRSLEGWLGTPLVDRGSYPVRLSEAGELFLPVAKRTVLQLLQARDETASSDETGARRVRFAAQHSISSNVLARWLSGMLNVDPTLRTHVLSGNLVDCFELLTNGSCEFAVCYRFPPIPLAVDERAFARLDIGADRLMPVASHAAAARHGWSLPAGNAGPIPYLAYERSSFLGAVVAHLTDPCAAMLQQRHSDAFAEALKSMALNGAGVAWLPESMIKAELDDRRLVRIGGQGWIAELKLSLFSPAELADEQALRIRECLRREAATP